MLESVKDDRNYLSPPPRVPPSAQWQLDDHREASSPTIGVGGARCMYGAWLYQRTTVELFASASPMSSSRPCPHTRNDLGTSQQTVGQWQTTATLKPSTRRGPAGGFVRIRTASTTPDGYVHSTDGHNPERQKVKSQSDDPVTGEPRCIAIEARRASSRRTRSSSAGGSPEANAPINTSFSASSGGT